MNTGIQDGHNLAWKLAAVLHGPFTPALLDTYEPERRTAARASLGFSRRMHRGYQSLEGDPTASGPVIDSRTTGATPGARSRPWT